MKDHIALLNALLSQMALLNPIPDALPPNIVADGNRVGIDILDRHGFVRRVAGENAVDGRPIYSLDFADTDLPPVAQSTINHVLRHISKITVVQ